MKDTSAPIGAWKRNSLGKYDYPTNQPTDDRQGRSHKEVTLTINMSLLDLVLPRD